MHVVGAPKCAHMGDLSRIVESESIDHLETHTPFCCRDFNIERECGLSRRDANRPQKIGFDNRLDRCAVERADRIVPNVRRRADRILY